MKQLATAIDLHDYDSPIKRADGKVPYNGYFWPTEDWWPSHEPQFRNRGGTWNFGIVALNDGRFSVKGALWHIEQNTTNPYPRPGDAPGKPVVFDCREKAIRVSAARFILSVRHQYRSRIGFLGDKISKDTAEDLINWTREAVAKACGAVTPSAIAMPNPPPSPPEPTGLELIDYINQKDHEDRVKPNAPRDLRGDSRVTVHADVVPGDRP